MIKPDSESRPRSEASALIIPVLQRSQVKMLLNEIEHGIRKNISLEEWEKL